MKPRVNRWMLELLGGDPAFHESSSILAPPALLARVTGGYKEVDGCVVPASFQGTSIWSPSRPRILNVDDETGFECRISEIHIEDFFETLIEFEELVRTGNDIAFLLGMELCRSRIEGRFRTIVSARVADPSCDVSNTCVVRYHKIRADQIYVGDDLEAYKGEAITIMDF